MSKRGSGFQLNRKQKEGLLYLLLFLLSVILLWFPGRADCYLIDDSYTYMEITSRMEGVMPVYPFFLYGNRLLFGEDCYLRAVVLEQTVFAAFCVLLFIRMLRKRFQLNVWETGVCLLLALLPFTADMPETMVNREILTEGIAYAAYYLFAAAFLQTVWRKSVKWYGILWAVTLMISAIRSQLQILFIACGAACIYVAVLRKGNGNRRKIPLRLLIGLAGCLLTVPAGVFMTSRISILHNSVAEKMSLYRDAEAESAVDAAKQEVLEEAETAAVEEPVTQEAENAPPQAVPEPKTSQYVTLIFNKGIYEADYEDYRLFEDEKLQNLFLRIYESIDREQCRYAYARSGLWMWKDLVKSAAAGVACIDAQAAFYAEECPEVYQSGSYSDIRSRNQIVIGLTLIKAHFGRFLYHTLMLLPQAFVSTVFFQIERFYLLCHLITLFLYLSAIVLTVWAYRDRKAERACGEFMCSVLGINLVLVIVISVVFFGQKRYLFYNFGLFYIAYFLLLLQAWKQYGKAFFLAKMRGKAKREDRKGDGSV